jgi:Glycosyl transferase family 2
MNGVLCPASMKGSGLTRVFPAKIEHSMSVLAIIVLYKRSVDQAQTLVSLGVALGRHPELLPCLRVLLWDNSPMPTAPTLAFPFDYVHSGKNVGTAGAFNRAMEFAETRSIPWLLLLDQDTTIPEDFLAKVVDYSYRFADSPEVAAVVPLLWCRGQLISPKRFRSLYRISPVPPACYGTYKEQLVVCDSATLMRTAALREAGGYDEKLFWLDFSDIYVFDNLRRNKRSIYIASDLQLQHSLSVMDYDRDMTPERYGNFLAAEGTFFFLRRSPLDNVALTIRLLARGTKQYLRYKNKTFAKMTWTAFCRTVLVSKAQRMKTWEKVLAGRG